MTRYSIESTGHIFVTGDGFLSFAEKQTCW